jgi:hypothetical protein
MNVSIISKPVVTDGILEEFARELPIIISDIISVPGGNLALLKPEQVSLAFSLATPRDVGSEIRIMVFARRNNPRSTTENESAKAILEKINTLIAKSGESYSVDVRLYLMEIGRAES